MQILFTLRTSDNVMEISIMHSEKHLNENPATLLQKLNNASKL